MCVGVGHWWGTGTGESGKDVSPAGRNVTSKGVETRCGVGGRFQREGTYVCLWPIQVVCRNEHNIVQQLSSS